MVITVVGKTEVQVVGPPDPEGMQPTWSYRNVGKYLPVDMV